MNAPPSIGVAIPAIGSRVATMLPRAFASVVEQTLAPARIAVSVDSTHVGAAENRNRAWRMLGDVDWIAFLDDDDELLPDHLDVLASAARETGADVVYSWFELPAAPGRIPQPVDPLYIAGTPAFGHPFDDEARDWMLTSGNFVPVTVLVRRHVMETVGGFPQPKSERWAHAECEDWGCWQDVLRAGFTFHHVPVRTWRWYWHAGNTSGRADRW